MPGDDSNGPTELPVDCRNTDELSVDKIDPTCEVVSGVPSGTIGTGPLLGLDLLEGLIDGDNVILASADFPGSHYVVLAIDYKTKVRRPVSGTYRDPQAGLMTVGHGPDITWVYDAARGPDGAYYFFVGDSNHPDSTWGSSLIDDTVIMRIDPVTGDRTEVLDFAQDSTACVTRSGKRLYPTDVFVIGGGFEDFLTFDIAADGAIYVGVGGNDADDRTWRGIARFRGGQCDLVSLTDSTGADSIGTGYQLEEEVGVLRVAGDAIYATPTGLDAVVKIDLATGDRRVLSTANEINGVVGTGPPTHRGYMALAPDGTIWTAGGEVIDSQATTVDPVTGDRTGYDGRGSWRPVYGVHADKPFAFYANISTVEVLEYTTGNHNIIAY